MTFTSTFGKWGKYTVQWVKKYLISPTSSAQAMMAAFNISESYCECGRLFLESVGKCTEVLLEYSLSPYTLKGTHKHSVVTKRRQNTGWTSVS